ncbi:hypothetical protein SteCoe_6357 [Stentor coeruleus]|uniref:Uncharacterized protein n=1 Tax=Stentor coeruleus TaxID=5963 RepID=A0A1R2CQC5_9CILI|nr:hypothetical protein SteCoe_6357 [Stentor coeruleus]
MEYKFGKVSVSTILTIFLGIQLVSIITNIISLCASTWIFPDSLLLTYEEKSIDTYYDKCLKYLGDEYEEYDDYDRIKELCDTLKIRYKVTVAYIVLIAFGMAFMAAWMFVIIKAIQGKFHLRYGILLGIISSLIQIVAIIQYVFNNKITFENVYSYSDSDYYGEAGDGPRLSVVICIINSLLVMALILIQKKLNKLRS